MADKKHTESFWSHHNSTIQIFGFKVLREKAIFYTIGCIGLIIVGVIAFGIILQFMGGSLKVEDAPDTVNPASLRQPVELPLHNATLAQLLDAHGQATGLATVLSLTFSGSFVAGEAELQHTLVFRQPGLTRQQLTHPRYSIVATYNLREAQVRAEDGAGIPLPTPDEIDSLLNKHALVLEGGLGRLIWSHADDQATVKVPGPESYNGRLCQVLELHHTTHPPIRYFLDIETGLEVARTLSFTDPNGDGHFIEVRLFDHRHTDGLRLPFRYEVFKDGESVATAQFERVTLNAGVVPSLFDPES
jgi:hypothetical protein